MGGAHIPNYYRFLLKYTLTKMTTFKASSATKNKNPLNPVPPDEVEKMLTNHLGGAKPESHFKLKGTPVSIGNGFVNAIHTAYAQHYPLVLTPDVIWMCIAQGLSEHVNANSEELRGHFVEHEGKKELNVRRDDFVKGSPDNPWPEVFEEFSEQIRDHVGGKTHDLLTPDFTTTGPIEKAAAQVVLMNTFKSYFEYSVQTSCEIPEITLEGTIDDWKKLRDKALSLAQYKLDWWIKMLKPVLDQFVKAASRKVDKSFWSTIYKQHGGSGGPFITGWIITLFPYVYQHTYEGKKAVPNPYLEKWKKQEMFGGMTSDMFPRGTVTTPFTWDYLGTKYPMHFYAGFMAVTQDPGSLSLCPEIGWAVVDDKEEQTSKERNPAHFLMF